MIWKNKPDIILLNDLSKKTAVEHLGISFTDIGDDYLEATMPVDHRTIQPAGILHGGASVLLAETLGSVASSLCVDNFSTQLPVGIEINANHIKSAKSGLVTGRAYPVKIGRTIHIWNIEIKDETGDLVCISRLTTTIIKRRQ